MKILIVLPVYNEESILTKNVNQVVGFCVSNLVGHDFTVVIANNNSTDQTGQIAQELSLQNPQVEHLFIDQKGKGLAIASAWQKYEADLYCFMDADLATDLSALIEVLKQIQLGNDIVIGSRFHEESRVERSWARRFISNCYRLFFKTLFKISINDFPCGFKIITKQVRDRVLKDTQNKGFFWDTEMLVIANNCGFKIVEIPIIWREFSDNNRKSQVNIIKTSLNYIKQSILLKIRLKK